MPLSFSTQNHGQIAFGFFNIESDMLLLENYFFFCSDFSSWMVEMAGLNPQNPGRFQYPVWQIKDPRDIGDLMGAIHGVRFTGFIGKLYQQFPFPENPSSFKQNTEGYRTREFVEAQVKTFAIDTILDFDYSTKDRVKIGPYEFSNNEFYELIRYVWRGGYPKWKEGTPPDDVIQMKNAMLQSRSSVFNGVFSS